MILHRFCSAKEFEAFQRGDLLVNNTDHSVKRGGASTSVGFCFSRKIQRTQSTGYRVL